MVCNRLRLQHIVWVFEVAADGRRQVELALVIFALVRAIRGPLLVLPANHAKERESMRLVHVARKLLSPHVGIDRARSPTFDHCDRPPE